MRKVKVIHYFPTIRNGLLFLFMSILFLCLQKSLQTNFSFSNTAFLKKVLVEQWGGIFLTVLGGMLLAQVRRLSLVFYSLNIVWLSYVTLEGLFISFNKLIFATYFVYLLFGYIFYHLIKEAVDLAYYNPKFKGNELSFNSSKELYVNLLEDEQNYRGVLSNWDESGIFIKLLNGGERLRYPECRFELDGEEFVAKGTVMAVNKKNAGFGLSMSGNQWSEYIQLIKDRGYRPRG